MQVKDLTAVMLAGHHIWVMTQDPFIKTLYEGEAGDLTDKDILSLPVSGLSGYTYYSVDTICIRVEPKKGSDDNAEG